MSLIKVSVTVAVHISSLTLVLRTQIHIMDFATADVSLALQLAQEELGAGGIDDEAGWFALQAALAEELSVVHDRELALRFGAVNRDSEAYAFGRDHDHNLGEDLAQQNAIIYKECSACGDESPATDTLDAPCTHPYCKACIIDLFTKSMIDESLFPPRCCQLPIPLDQARTFLSADAAALFEAKQIEFTTTDRTYCWEPTCSTFISPNTWYYNWGLARCPQCHRLTCTKCKAKFHLGGCPEDAVTQQILDMATQDGWKRCFNCRRMVEILHGCNHMTYAQSLACTMPFYLVFNLLISSSCYCHAEFCYECGLQWKTCRCPVWDEARLLQEGQRRLDRDGNNGNAEVANAQQVHQAAARVLNRHDCPHEAEVDWIAKRRADGENTMCEMCHCRKLKWVWECPDCGARFCMTCRRNRL